MTKEQNRDFAETWGEVTLGSSKIPVRLLAVWLGAIAWIIATIIFTGTQGIIAFSLNVAYLLALIAVCKATRTVPLKRLALCFFLGGVTLGVVALIMQPFVQLLGTSSPLRPFLIPIVEESFKLLPLALIIFRGRKFTTWTLGMSDLMLLGASSGAGFAFVEDAHIHKTIGWQTLSSWLPATDIVNGHVVAGHGIWTALAGSTIAAALFLRQRGSIAWIVAVSGLGWSVFDHIVVNYAQLNSDWAVNVFTFLTGNGIISIVLFVVALCASVAFDLYINFSSLPKFAEFGLPSAKERSDSLTSIWEFILDRRRLAYAYFRYQRSTGAYHDQLSGVVAVLAQCLINGHKPRAQPKEQAAPAQKELPGKTPVAALPLASAAPPPNLENTPGTMVTQSHSNPQNQGELFAVAIEDIDLPERYFVISELSQGGMGVIYRAQHRMTGKKLAIKILHPHVARNQQNIRRFEQEAKAASLLKHPNLVDVLDFGVTSKNIPFLVMDLIEGNSLQSDIRDKGPLSFNRFLNIFIQCCDALSHAHKRGVIHRDLKPSNMLLTVKDDGSDFIKIVDFGIAKVVANDGGITQELTRTGDIVGSPLFMSPEQCMGNHLDSRSDVYSIGCVMYNTITGHLPFMGQNAVQTIFKQLNEMPVRPKNLRPDVPDSIEMLIFKSIQKDPAGRYSSMEEIQHELMRIKSVLYGELV